MNHSKQRIFMCTKDIMLITGKSRRTACRIMTAIKARNRKPPLSPITIYEYCEFTGLTQEQVSAFLT